MIGYQIKYWQRDYHPDRPGMCWANSIDRLCEWVRDHAQAGVIRIEIVADDGRGEVVVGDLGVNKPPAQSQSSPVTCNSCGGSGYTMGAVRRVQKRCLHAMVR